MFKAKNSTERAAICKAMKAAMVNGCDPYNSANAAGYWFERQAKFRSFKSKR